MNDKDFNRSILAELYKIADQVFAEGVNVPEGSYTASELIKRNKKVSIFRYEYIKREVVCKTSESYCGSTIYSNHNCEVAPIYSVKVGSFEASFCASKVFDLVARFEKLAGVSKAKQHLFTVSPETTNEIGSVTVWLDKSMAEMVKFCDRGKLTLNITYKQVAIDFRNRKIVATDGRVLNVRKLTVIEDKGEIPTDIYPLVDYKEFEKLCNSAGKNGCAVKCSLIKDGEMLFWVCEASKVEAKKWPDYFSLFGGIIKDKLVSLDDSEWKKVAKWLKQNNKIEPTGCVFVHHEEGADAIRFIIKYSETNTEYTVKCASVPREAFIMCFQRANLLTACKTFNLDISHKRKWSFNLDKGCVSLIMPSYFPSECDGLVFDWEITGEKVNVFEYCGFNGNAQETPIEAKEMAEACNSSAVDKEMQCKPVLAPQKELSELNESAPERDTENARKTKDNSKRITLYSIGLRNGDELQFVDGQTVTVCSEKKVAYEGKEYTLTGFTKAFILKQNKSGAYRGIMYYYKDGVRLDKYAEAYLSDRQNTKTSCTASKAIWKKKTARFEAGKKLNAEEKREVLSALRDSYKENGVPYHIEETYFGREKRVYEPTLDDYVTSDITGMRLRYYITLPDGRIAHPSELFPNISNKDIQGAVQRQMLLDKEVDYWLRSAISILDNYGVDKCSVMRLLVKLQEMPHETRYINYGAHNTVSYRYRQGVFISDFYQALSYISHSVQNKENFSGNVLIATQKAVAKCFGMVDNLISRLRSMGYDGRSSDESSVLLDDTGCNDTDKPPMHVSNVAFARVLVALLNIVFESEWNPFALRRVPGCLFVGGGLANNTRVLYASLIVAHKRRITTVHTLCNPPPWIDQRAKRNALHGVCANYSQLKNKQD